MKHFLIVLAITCSFASVAQRRNVALKALLDSTIARAQAVSLYSETVDWTDLSDKMDQLAEAAETTSDLKPAFELLLNSLRDHHGNIRAVSGFPILASFTDHKNSRSKENREFDSEIWGIVNNLEARFEYALLPQKVGYLKVVGIGPNVDGQKEAERIRNAIIELSEQNVKEWIVDLRYNGGGNINVMLAGLAPLLDTKTVASIQDRNDERDVKAEIIDNNFWYAGQQAFEMPAEPILENQKIAILTSRWTWSSGELIAVAFKGQQNTKFFGEDTGGYTTNNCWEIINNQIALVISTGIYCDRNGNIYVDNVKPDIAIPFVVETDKAKDVGIIEALKWIGE